jgi:flagellar hook-associated protein 3 FlgL
MRITEKIIQRNVVGDVNKHLASMAKLQQQVSTGKRIQGLSDDPSRAARSLSLGAHRSALTQYQENTESALAWMNASVDALTHAHDTLQAARQDALSGGTDTLSNEGRQALVTNVNRLKEQLLGIANSTWKGLSLFAGQKTTTTAFSPLGVYQGDGGQITRDTSPNEASVVNVRGDQAFTGAENLFTLLDDLSAALAANDTAAVRATLPRLDAGLNQILTIEGQMGAETKLLETTQERLNELDGTLTKRISENDDTDMTRAVVDLQNANNLYEASLAASSKLFQSTLLDFLR